MCVVVQLQHAPCLARKRRSSSRLYRIGDLLVAYALNCLVVDGRMYVAS